MTSGLKGLLAASLMTLTVSTASALTVNYVWVPTTGGGSGSITLSSNAITDASNFSSIDVSALTGLTYTWNNGAAIDLLSITTNNATSWDASGGFLINGFQITSSNDANTNAIGTYSLASSAGLPNNPGPAATGLTPLPLAPRATQVSGS